MRNMRTSPILSMPEDAGTPPTPMARRRELLLACSALIGILAIGAGTWAAAPIELGGAAATSDVLSPILDSVRWALSAN
jgi:hypothetical protein